MHVKIHEYLFVRKQDSSSITRFCTLRNSTLKASPLQHKGGGWKEKNPQNPNQTEWSVVRGKMQLFWNCPLETDICYSPASPFLRALAEHELWCVSCDFSLFSLSKCSFGNLLFWNCFISSPLVSVKWKEAHQLNGHIFITVFFLQSC